jgi:hypothetical protein
MEKDRAYNMHPGDVLFLLRDQYPFKLEERMISKDELKEEKIVVVPNDPLSESETKRKKKISQRASGSLSRANVLLKSLPDLKKSLKEEKKEKKRTEIASHSDLDMNEMKSSLASLRTVEIERDFSAQENLSAEGTPLKKSGSKNFDISTNLNVY